MNWLDKFRERTHIWSWSPWEWMLSTVLTVITVTTVVSRWQEIFTREISFISIQIWHCSGMLVFSGIFNVFRVWMRSQPEWIYIVFPHKVRSLVILYRNMLSWLQLVFFLFLEIKSCYIANAGLEYEAIFFKITISYHLKKLDCLIQHADVSEREW